MAQTVSQIVAALASSDKCSIVSMKSPKHNFNEILSDFSKSTENDFQALQGPSNNGATRLVIVVDRLDASAGSGGVTVERRL
jgi:hypothetical protein